MLNRYITIGVIGGLNLALDFFIGFKYGLHSLNNWLLMLSCAFLGLAIYRLLGMVEGYRN